MPGITPWLCQQPCALRMRAASAAHSTPSTRCPGQTDGCGTPETTECSLQHQKDLLHLRSAACEVPRDIPTAAGMLAGLQEVSWVGPHGSRERVLLIGDATDGCQS